MKSNNDNKAVSTIIGFLLILVIIILVFSIAQDRASETAKEDEFLFTENKVVYELEKLEDYKKTSLNIVSNERLVLDDNVEYSLIVNLQRNVLISSDNNINFNKEEKDVNIVYQNPEENTVIIDEKTESLNIEYDFIYSNNKEFKKEHTYLTREEGGIIIQGPNLIFDDEDRIILRSVEYNIDYGPGTNTIDFIGNAESENITATQTFTYSIETSTPVDEFEHLEEKNNIISVDREGEYIEITLNSGSYEIITEEISININN